MRYHDCQYPSEHITWGVCNAGTVRYNGAGILRGLLASMPQGVSLIVPAALLSRPSPPPDRPPRPPRPHLQRLLALSSPTRPPADRARRHLRECPLRLYGPLSRLQVARLQVRPIPPAGPITLVPPFALSDRPTRSDGGGGSNEGDNLSPLFGCVGIAGCARPRPHTQVRQYLVALPDVVHVLCRLGLG